MKKHYRLMGFFISVMPVAWLAALATIVVFAVWAFFAFANTATHGTATLSMATMNTAAFAANIVIITGIALTFIGNRATRQLFSFSEYDCDPQAYLKVAERLRFKACFIGRMAMTLQNIMYFQVLSLLYLDRAKEAALVLSELDTLCFSRVPKTYRPVVTTLLSSLAFQLDNKELSDKYHALLVDYVSQARIKKQFVTLVEGYTQNLDERLRMESQKDVSGLLQFYDKALANIPPLPPRQQVEVHYRRAACLISLDQFDKAKQALGYVIAHGNKMSYVQQAQRALTEIEARETLD